MSNRTDPLIQALLGANLLLVAAGATGVGADTLRVPSEYPTIQAGIDAAQDGDEVLAADGVYTGDGNRDIDFGGKSITVISENGPDNCIIDCRGQSAVPVHRGFFFHSGETAASVVDGFTITNGSAIFGAGIRCSESSSPTIMNCTIVENRGSMRGAAGGGVSCDDNSNPTITNCTITGNTAGYGAGIDCFESSPTITSCTITGNTARFQGGGIACWDSNATIADCTIIGNTSGRMGGGILCGGAGSSPTITNCTITGNTASDKYSNGGGIMCSDNSPTITDCNISGNAAQVGGGILCGGAESNPTITNCAITGNEAHEGGGLFCASSTTTIADCTIAGNTASFGGGVVFGGGAPTIINCLIIGNEAIITRFPFGRGTGGGVYAYGGTLTMANCTFAENSASAGRALAFDWHASNAVLADCVLWNGGDEVWNNDDSTITITYSDVYGGWEGEGNIDADPLFVPGPIGSYYLSQTAAGNPQQSPCVDAGSDTAQNLGLDTLTTRSDEVADSGIVDMGYHYPITGGAVGQGRFRP